MPPTDADKLEAQLERVKEDRQEAFHFLARVILSYKRAYRDPGLLTEIETYLESRNVTIADHEQ